MLLITVDLDGNLFAKCPGNGMGCHIWVFQPQREVNHCLTSLTGPNSASYLGHAEY